MTERQHGAISSAITMFLFTIGVGVASDYRITIVSTGQVFCLAPVIMGLVLAVTCVITFLAIFFPPSEEFDRKNNPEFSREHLQGHRVYGWAGCAAALAYYSVVVYWITASGALWIAAFAVPLTLATAFEVWRMGLQFRQNRGSRSC